MSEYSSGQGPATDRHNEPVVDPTANVFQLVDAAIRRQDDLRIAEKEHVTEVLRLRGELRENDLDHLAEIVALRAEEREKDIEHLKETAALRADHENQLREAEAKRIDAIRAVDVGAVAAAAAVQTTQASTLAAQVASSAEALRNQVAAAASAQTVALAAALEPIIKDIADLRRAQYEAQGQKAQVVDARANTGAVVGYIVGGVGALVAVVTLLVVLVSNPPA